MAQLPINSPFDARCSANFSLMVPVDTVAKINTSSVRDAFSQFLQRLKETP